MISSFGYWENLYHDPMFTGSQDYDGWLSAYAAEIRPGSCVLDLGCGVGTNLDALLSCGAKVSAADFSSTVVEDIQKNYGEQLEAVNCFDMRCSFPYADSSFDFVVADLSLHYFSKNETHAIIAEIHRILRSGGKLLARVHSVHNLQDMNAEKIEENYYIVGGIKRRYFTPEDIQALFSQWQNLQLDEHSINRYHRQKQIIEFSVQKA